MKNTLTILFSVSVFLGACATAAPPEAAEPRVPVYRPTQETPCRYEEIQHLVVETRLVFSGRRAYEVAREKELGEAGARMGADAVILTDATLRLPFMLPGDSRAPQERDVRFEGLAVRWLPDTCRARRSIPLP